MSQATAPPQPQAATITATPSEETKQTPKTQKSVEELVNSLKTIAEDIGQIAELTGEEKSLTKELFVSLTVFMRPLAKTLSVAPEAFPAEMGDVAQAHFDSSGHLMIVYQDKHVELKDLRATENRDLMIAVVRDAMPRFKDLTAAQRQKIEARVTFLSAVTKEMQKIANALSAANENGT
jgi:hypothetical protein